MKASKKDWILTVPLETSCLIVRDGLIECITGVRVRWWGSLLDVAEFV